MRILHSKRSGQDETRARWRAGRRGAAHPVALLGAALTLSAALDATAAERREAGAPRSAPGVHEVLLPDLVYLGNPTCSGSDCHSADEPTMQSGQKIGNELNIWSEYDPHSRAYRQLENEESKKIAKKLEIDDPTTSQRCLTCHGTNVPSKRQGQQFTVKTSAVGCESCHGPAEKWNEPHAKEGWTAEKREKLGADGLQKEYGLLDTSNLSARAHTCVACHLQIDKDMIDAGHPPLEFELYAYNYYTTSDDYYRHWSERDDPVLDAKMWAAGQLAAAQAAEAQLADWKEQGWDTSQAQSLHELYAAGAAIVKEHFGIEKAKNLSDGAFTPERMAKAAQAIAKLTDQADNERERRVVAFGLTAVGSSVFKGRGEQVPGPFWNAYKRAKSGKGGAAYEDAVAEMAELVKQ